MAKTIGTHNGPFHADEALAVFMLKKLPEFADATVVRSRDNALLDECDIVVDVGARYEPPKYFDHHQREFTDTFDAEHTVTRLSSAGLVYKHFGRRVIQSILQVEETDPVLDAVYPRIYNKFIEAVDAFDNGVNPHDEKERYDTHANTLRAVVSNMHPLWTEDESPAAFDAQFVKASEFMGLAFELEVKSAGRSWYPARTQVEQAFAERFQYDPKGRVLVLNQWIPFGGHLYELEELNNTQVLYVVAPSADSWRMRAVSVSPSSFESRCPLLDEWRGLRDEKLAEVSGFASAVFVHASGFIGGAKTKEDALGMALKTIEASECSHDDKRQCTESDK